MSLSQYRKTVLPALATRRALDGVAARLEELLAEPGDLQPLIEVALLGLRTRIADIDIKLHERDSPGTPSRAGVQPTTDVVDDAREVDGAGRHANHAGHGVIQPC